MTAPPYFLIYYSLKQLGFQAIIYVGQPT